MNAYSEVDLLLILVGISLFVVVVIGLYVSWCWNEEVFEDEIIEEQYHDYE
jgi:nitrogen fixation-related uncharacterized protein